MRRGDRAATRPRSAKDRCCIRLNIQWDGAYIGFPGMEMDVRRMSRFGLGLIHVETFALLVGMQARQRFFATPIDADHIHLRAAVQVRRLPDEEMTRNVDTDVPRGVRYRLRQRLPDLGEQDHRSPPMLSARRTVQSRQNRRWARQFYSEYSAADVPVVAPPRAAVHAKLDIA